MIFQSSILPPTQLRASSPLTSREKSMMVDQDEDFSYIYIFEFGITSDQTSLNRS